MRLLTLVPFLALAACTDNATKQESVQIFAAATTAMSSAQADAVEQARAGHLVAPADVQLDFSGPCSLGGSVALAGSYAGDSNDERAVFDLQTTFAGCREVTGTLDGNLRWQSDASADGFSASITGELDWTGNDGSASCDFDLSLAITPTSVHYEGHLCGYDAGELILTAN